MKIIDTPEKWIACRREAVGSNALGLVPTLGGLHEGHFSLVKRSLQENDITVVTIFLNRTQFNQAADWEAYPADREEDLAALRELGVDAVFAPSHDSMYADGYRYKITERDFSARMEGEHRPGHFDGVLTVVLKLLALARECRAYFGEKDYQQLQLIRGMAKAFFLPAEIVACPTVRADDGLALSSRNRRLSPEARQQAAQFPEILNTALNAEAAKAQLAAAGFEIDYIEEEDGRRYGAVSLEGVRLIDNMELKGIPHAAAS